MRAHGDNVRVLAVDMVVEDVAWGVVVAIEVGWSTVWAVFDGGVVAAIGDAVFVVGDVVVGEVSLVVALGGDEASHVGVGHAGEEEA